MGWGSNTRTVGDLKTLFSDALDLLENLDDKIEIRFESNTYFVNNAKYFLGCSAGYLDLEKIADNLEEDEDCDGDCDNCDNDGCPDHPDYDDYKGRSPGLGN